MPITQKGITKLLKHHKLDADENTDSDVNDAIKNSVSQDEMDQVENRNTDLEKENKSLKNRAEAGDRAAEALVDQTLEQYKNRIGDKPEAKAFFRDGLVNNREETIKVLEALPEPKGGTTTKREEPIHNRKDAKTPTSSPDAPSEDRKKEEARAGKVAARAREIREKTPSIGNRASFDQAEREIKD